MSLLSVRPGVRISVDRIFDEGSILSSSNDPDGDYRRLIWPCKSVLGLFYEKGIIMDFKLILLTLHTMVRRDGAGLPDSRAAGGMPELCQLVLRRRNLKDGPPSHVEINVGEGR